MLIESQLTEAIKIAMREKDMKRLGVLRLILSGFKQVKIDKRIEELSDEQSLDILGKMLKQRKESITHYLGAQEKRQDLADKEQFEIGIIQSFMPQALEADHIQKLIDEAIELFAATSIKDMGKVMAHLKPQLQGRADLTAVGLQVKTRLSQLD